MFTYRNTSPRTLLLYFNNRLTPIKTGEVFVSIDKLYVEGVEEVTKESVKQELDNIVFDVKKKSKLNAG